MLYPKEIGVAIGIGLIALTVGSTPAKSAMITFNDLSLGTTVTNQYASVGALFSVSGVTPATIQDITVDNGSNTPYGPNGIRILQGSPWDDYVAVEFVDPTDQNIPAFMTSVSFSYISDLPGPTHGSITAFDDLGNVVDQMISVLGGDVYETLTVTGSAIRSVHIDGFDDVIIDQITFTTANPTPLPPTLPLFAVGLAAVALVTRHSKRKAGRAFAGT